MCSHSCVFATGSYGTWTSANDDHCPSTTAGATVDGWVQIDQGNEYSMMQAVSYQPISVDVTADGKMFGYSVSNAAQGSKFHHQSIPWLMQHDATELFHLCFGSILVSSTIAHRLTCPVSMCAWLLHAVRQNLHSWLLYIPDRQSSDMRANLMHPGA